MAQLSRRLAPHLSALAAAPSLLFAPAAAAAVDLAGSWHVLVHYRDASTANPDALRWEDRVWEFATRGSRLEWVEFPIVVFDDESGRFERREGTGQYARVLHAWEPSAAQLANLRRGLAVNDRGSQKKSLRRIDGAWRSSARASPTSASVVTYQETWSIEDPEGLPVFAQVDRLGSARAGSLEGRTLLRTLEVRDGGALLVGSFERDDARRGSFEMRRSGPRQPLPKRTQAQLQARAAARMIRASDEFRGGVLEFAREELADAGIYLDDAEIESLVDEATELSASGWSAEEIRKRQRRSVRDAWFSFAPVSPEHDDSARYRFPFDVAVPRRLAIGVGAEMAQTVLGPTSDWSGHMGWSRYSFDFELPAGAEVLAARDGEVVRTGTQFTERSERSGRSAPSAQVVVLHADGTYAIYGHLAATSVARGDRVAAGDEIGRSRGPLLHFGVARYLGDGRPESLAIRFDDGSAAGVAPISGLFYGGRTP